MWECGGRECGSVEGENVGVWRGRMWEHGGGECGRRMWERGGGECGSEWGVVVGRGVNTHFSVVYIQPI